VLTKIFLSPDISPEERTMRGKLVEASGAKISQVPEMQVPNNEKW
jgi:hypothetical protein